MPTFSPIELIGAITALLVVFVSLYTAFRSARNDGYDQLEKVAARMEISIKELQARVTALETDKDNLQARIVELEIENAQLRARMNGKGFSLK